MRTPSLLLALALATPTTQALAGDDLHTILIGAAGGAAGAAVGQSVGGKEGAIVGAAIGGATGAILAKKQQRPVVVEQPAKIVHVYQPAPRYYHKKHKWKRHPHGRHPVWGDNDD